MCDSGDDPTPYTIFVQTFPNWHPYLGNLSGQLPTELDANVQAALSLGLGLIDSPRTAIVGFEETDRWVQELYQNAPEIIVHGAAKWCLGQWHETLPELTDSRPQHGNWFEIVPGLSFHQISKKDLDQQRADQRLPAGPTSAIYVCDTEIRVDQYQRFAREMNSVLSPLGFSIPMSIDGRASPGPLHPAQHVSAKDAVIFCNWLSHRFGRKHAYERQNGAWILVEDANGFRLPRLFELRAACRSRSSKVFHFGSEAESHLATQYACFDQNSNVGLKRTTMPCGTKLPNRFGLFDTLGNVHEWCWLDETNELADPLGTDQWNQPYRGGQYKSSLNSLGSGGTSTN